MTIKLSVVDEAIVVDVLIDGDGWAGGGAAADTVIQGRAVITGGGVTRRVGDGGGHHEVSAGNRGVDGQGEAISEHRLSDGAAEQGVTG
ncbi:hypothetical protein, partial [Shewanella nanhaiensis]